MNNGTNSKCEQVQQNLNKKLQIKLEDGCM